MSRGRGGTVGWRSQAVQRILVNPFWSTVLRPRSGRSRVTAAQRPIPRYGRAAAELNFCTLH
eukprot:4457732-Prymnesium_polylepis.1